jgi:FkbM family methyltransferase
MSVLLCKKTIMGQRFTYTNQGEFLYIYFDIFCLGSYRFWTRKKTPLIIDCGAHIGISIHYFKKKYPQAHIIGFEANPETFKLLEKNVKQNQLSNVELIQAAVSDQDGIIPFYVGQDSEGELMQWGDTGIQNMQNQNGTYTTIMVPSKCLSSYIKQPVDLLKLDIEGMEGIVLKDIESKLYLVKQIIMEHHGSGTNPENKLEDTLALLERCGFRYVLQQGVKVVRLTQVNRNDTYLNIYAYRRVLPWWWHYYCWYLPSRVLTVGRPLWRIAHRLLMKR